MKELFLGKSNAFFAMFDLRTNFGSWRLLDVKNFNFRLGSRLDTKGKKSIFKKVTLELLKFVLMYQNSSLIGWKLYWTVWDKKHGFFNFFFHFFIFSIFSKFRINFWRFFTPQFKNEMKNWLSYWLALAQENQKGPVSRASTLLTKKVIELRTAYKPFPGTLIL